MATYTVSIHRVIKAGSFTEAAEAFYQDMVDLSHGDEFEGMAVDEIVPAPSRDGRLTLGDRQLINAYTDKFHLLRFGTEEERNARGEG